MASLRQVCLRLVDLEIWIVGLLAVGSILSSALLPFVPVVALFFWLIRWVGTGRLTRRTPLDLAVVLLILVACVNLWATAVPRETEIQLYRLFSGIALYYALSNWATSSTRLGLVIAGLVTVGLAFALIAPFSVTWYTVKLPFIPAEVYNRFTLLVSDTVHPNTMGGNLVILMPIPLAILMFSWNQFPGMVRAGLSAILLVMFGVLILTKSRGGWISFAVVLFVLAFLRWRLRWLLILFLLAIAGLILVSTQSAVVLDILTANDALGGFEGRLEIWSRALYMIRDYPFTGIGLGSYVPVVDHLYPFFRFVPGQIVHSHNLFLQIAVDLGIPGLIFWTAILFLVSTTAWQVFFRARESQPGWLAGLGAGLFCSQLALIIHGATDAVTWGLVRTAPLVWIVWGLAVAARLFQVDAVREGPEVLPRSLSPVLDPSSREI
jgi:putative inorganic carbon (HCO3(-)) transporter